MTIVIPQNPSEQEQLAAKEVRRYIYVRTDQLLNIVHSDSVPEQKNFFILIGKTDQPLFEKLNLGLSTQEYLLKNMRLAKRKVFLIAGGDNSAVLYGAYRFAELLGVRFYLHNDVLPDEKIALKIPAACEQRKPLFAIRGIHPFHDFPEGPDWWNLDDYKAVLAQLPKMGMNFFALHTYPDNQPFEGVEKGPEPVVWIGQESDINPDGSVVYSSQARHATTRTGTWGYKRMKTSDYHLGAHLLFERDDYGADYMIDRTPWPETAQERNELFDEFGSLLDNAFTFGHKLGVKTCVGSELPLTIPQVVKNRLQTDGKDPDSPQVIMSIYQGMFRWIEKNYPLDYYWLWTHEGWTWEGVSDEEVENTEQNLLLACQALENVGKPFRLATCGWVLGPPKDRTQFDDLLPKDVAFSCINRQLGKDPVDRNFSAIKDREKWAIPWLEDDPRLISPQLWAGRMRQDACDALSYGCNGLLGIHWRTRMLEPTVSALAKAGWDQSWAVQQPTDNDSDSLLAFASGKAIKVETDSPEPYKSIREGARLYRFKVNNGIYKVKLYFIEPTFRDLGRRLFAIRLQGDRKIHEFDIVKEAGFALPKEISFDNILVTDGSLTVDLVPQTEEPCLAGISIIGENKTLNVNCGASNDDTIWKAEPIPLPPPGRDKPCGDFYRDWARASFGKKVSKKIADIFTRLDGHLPEPSQWQHGPGAIMVTTVPREEVAEKYTFIEELEKIQKEIDNPGNIERFNYWLNVFKFMRSTARLGCALGKYQQAIDMIKDATSTQRPHMARDIALPLRLELTNLWAEMEKHLLAYVDTPGDFGTVANIEQHNWLALNLLHQHDESMEKWLGHELPEKAFLSQNYGGDLRVVIPTKRTLLEKSENFNLKMIVLSKNKVQTPLFYWRHIGKKEFLQQTAQHITRGVYRISLDKETIAGNDFEYYISVQDEAETASFPAIAPEINFTVVVL